MAPPGSQEPVERDLMGPFLFGSMPVSLLAHQPDFMLITLLEFSPGSCLQFLVARSNFGDLSAATF